jgi:monothiol glutaredoxin
MANRVDEDRDAAEADTALTRTWTLVEQCLPLPQLVIPDLPGLSPIDREAATRARAEALELERESLARQGAMSRYMDSRDAAGNDGHNERVLDQDPLRIGDGLPIWKVDPEQEKTMSAEAQIRDTIAKNDVVLFMKGTKMMPQCGFSSRVAGVLNFMGVEFQDVNVLADAEIRQGIKDFSDWPTIPQLYVKGEFVGGCDIVTEMTLSGELDQLFETKGVSFDKAAADKIREANA